MILRFKLVYFLFFLIVVGACKKDPAKTFIKQKIGAGITLPEKFEILNYNLPCINLKDYNKPVQIIHFFNGDCGYCLANLQKWKQFIEFLNFTNEIDYIFFAYTDNKKFLDEDVYEKVLFKKQVFIINKNEFLSKNQIPEDMTSLYTFLIIDDKIRLIGNPINNPRIKILYEEQILQYLQGN